MTILRIETLHSRLLTDNEELLTTLWRLMRYREKGYFHTALYKQKKWDGYREFFKKASGRFLTGLLPEVTAALDHLKIPYQTEDLRPPFKWAMREINEDFLKLWGCPYELFDYQVDLTNQVLKHCRAVVQAPTGAGKTLIMVSILKCLLQGTPTLIMANRKSLCD